MKELSMNYTKRAYAMTILGGLLALVIILILS